MSDDNKTNEYSLDTNRVKANFNRAAATYNQVAVLQREVAQRLVDRLSYMNITPQWGLDVGSGTGYGGTLLAAQYSELKLINFDIAHAMLQQARQQHGQRDPSESCGVYICGDAERLPLGDASVDLIFSNMAIQWCNQIDQVFAEFRRVLKTNGCLIFSTVGPDTLKELRTSWAQADTSPHVNAFFDMHDLGDALLRCGFADPVMDVDHFTLTYSTVQSLMGDLKRLGSRNATVSRSRGLTGRTRLEKMQQAYEKFRVNDTLPVTYEITYGHAWKLAQTPPSGQGGGSYNIPVAAIRRQRRMTS